MEFYVKWINQNLRGLDSWIWLCACDWGGYAFRLATLRTAAPRFGLQEEKHFLWNHACKVNEGSHIFHCKVYLIIPQLFRARLHLYNQPRSSLFWSTLLFAGKLNMSRGLGVNIQSCRCVSSKELIIWVRMIPNEWGKVGYRDDTTYENNVYNCFHENHSLPSFMSTLVPLRFE